jgi:hypothetical protein
MLSLWKVAMNGSVDCSSMFCATIIVSLVKFRYRSIMMI